MSSQQRSKITSKKKRNKEITTSIIIIVVVFGGTFGGFFILRASLHTKMPLVVVSSGSMVPTLNKGDLLFVKGEDPANITAGSHENKTGDIIIYWAQGVWLPNDSNSDPIVHRCIGKYYNATLHEYFFETQGDANPYPDNPNTVTANWIPQGNVVGVVVGRVPYVGWVKLWLTSSGLAIPIIVILCVLLVISIVYDITHPDKKDEKEEKKKEKMKETEEQYKKGTEEFSRGNIDMGV